MSAVIPTCRTCSLNRSFARVVPVGNQSHYGVEWRCHRCGDEMLDICPVGPLIPSRETCINCATPLSAGGESACPHCGMTPAAARQTFALDSAPADPVAAAGKLFETGLIRRAIAILNQALLANATLAAAWEVKYSFLSSLGFHASALTVIEEAGKHVANSDLLISRGYELQALDRHAEAVEVYRQYFADAPNGEFAGVALGNSANSLRKLNNDSAAEELYRQAIARDPKTPDNYANYVRLLIDQKRYEEAHPLIDKGWECSKDPATVAQFLEDKAAVFAEQLRGEESLKCADAAIAQAPNRVRGRYLRGRALALLGRLAEAREAMQAVLKLDPKNADALRASGMIDQAKK